MMIFSSKELWQIGFKISFRYIHSYCEGGTFVIFLFLARTTIRIRLNLCMCLSIGLDTDLCSLLEVVSLCSGEQSLSTKSKLS